MGVFIDTGFFLGFLHKKDSNHEKCVNLFRNIIKGEYGLLYTSSYVISETVTTILLRTHNNLATLEIFWDMIYGTHTFIRIIHSSTDINQKSWNIFKSHNKNTKKKRNYLSFVDASNIAICREKQITYILTLDADFDSYLTRL